VYFLLVILGTRLGTAVLAANGVILQFFALTAFGLDGLANAAEALVGEAIGAGDPMSLTIAVRVSVSLEPLFGLSLQHSGSPPIVHSPRSLRI
jgi:MATE family multidrug resistance protein